MASTADRIVRVEDIADPRLDVYRHLKDKQLKAREGLFIAEGPEVVRRLLRSRLGIHSLLVTPGKLERLRGDLRTDVPVYVGSIDQIERIAGFTIHRGALACGVRPAPIDLETAIGHAATGRVVVVLEGLCDAQNVGVIIRNAAAFGASLVVLHNCCDPFYRRAVRVSMGNVFSIPLYFSQRLREDLLELRRRASLTLVAADPSSEAEPLGNTTLPRRAALIVGAEGEGLSKDVLSACDQRVGVPMMPGTDSVNVAVASGIFLYAMTRAHES